MQLLVTWKPCPGLSPAQREESLEVFTRWTPPVGLEIKAMYGRAGDGGGFAIVEADSAEAAFAATAPWAGTYLDYDLVPIVEIEKAVELSHAAIAFRKG